MQAVILTGVVAGFVHVVSGADHLIAMVPAAINNPQKALKNSFSWGLGHSSGILLLAFLAIFIKDIKKVKRFILISEPIKYEIKYKQALVKGSAKAGRTARKCEPPAIPCSKPKPVRACECLLLFFCSLT